MDEKIAKLKEAIIKKTCAWQYNICGEHQTPEEYCQAKKLEEELEVLYKELYELDPDAEHNWHWQLGDLTKVIRYTIQVFQQEKWHSIEDFTDKEFAENIAKGLSKISKVRIVETKYCDALPE